MSDKSLLYEYKGNSCKLCRMSVSEMVERYGTFNRMFELHHIDPGKKAKNYNSLIRKRISKEQLDEVDKCVLLCRVCHGLIHAQNNRVTVKLEIDYTGRTITRDFSGWLNIDRKDNIMSFFSEEHILLEQYVEILPSGDERIIFGVDLESGERYFDITNAMRVGDIYQIFSAKTRELMLRVTDYKDKRVIDLNLQFGFIQINNCEAKKGEKYWYRNGMMIHENGEIEKDGFYTITLIKNVP